MTTARNNKPIGRFYELQQEVAIPDDYVLTSKIRIKPLTRGQAIALRKATDEEEADRIYLGEHADAVFALYADRPAEEWAAFVADMYKHFMGAGVDDQGKSEESSS